VKCGVRVELLMRGLERGTEGGYSVEKLENARYLFVAVGFVEVATAPLIEFQRRVKDFNVERFSVEAQTSRSLVFGVGSKERSAVPLYFRFG